MRSVILALASVAMFGCSTIQSSSSIRDDEARTFTGSPEAVYSEAVATLMGLGWQVAAARKEERLIQARTPMTIWTWGDLVTVHVVELAPGRARVDVTSGSRQQFDWGKNRENIERF